MRNNPERISLTDEQLNAEDAVTDIILDGGVASLTGYAGTGKTHLLRHIVDKYGPEFNDTYMMAPTHKAAEVLGRRTGYEVQTIHSAFGMRPKPDGKGGYKFVPTGDGPKKFVWGSLLAIDEGSMIPNKLYTMIMESADAHNLSVVISGDLAQLPPVNEDPSPALDHDGYKLEEIVRQEKGNPIIETSMMVREDENYDFETRVNDDKGVFVVDDRMDLVERAFQSFDTDIYAKRGDHARVLAYRNDVVETYNDVFRSMLYGDTDEQYVNGEWLVATEPWFGTNDEYRSPIIQNSEEFIVEGKIPSSLYGFDTWELEISSGPDSDDYRHIEVLNRDEMGRYQRKLDELAEAAKDDGRKWRDYYNYKESFAHVDYSYAMTTHRAQGSTFTETFVDMEDVHTCPNPHEIQRLKYVAVTRASDKLTIFDP